MIKKHWIVLFLFCFNASKSQTYVFESMLNYETNRVQNDLIYCNKTDNTFSLHITRYYDNSLKAELFDYKAKQKHFFEVNENKKNNEIHFSFIYSKSIKLHEDVDNNCKLEKSNDSIENINHFKLNIYKNKKMKKVLRDYYVTVEESEFNYFHTIRHFLSDHGEPTKLLDFKKSIVKNLYYETKFHKQVFNIKLKDVIDIYYELKLPEKLNFNP